MREAAGNGRARLRGGGDRALLLLVSCFLLLRLATLGVLPLFDATESRYAEIGREMAVSGNWVTPTLHGGEPFWAKPPLHFWMTALAMRIFGATEWAARLPSFLAALGTLLLTAALGRSLFGRSASLRAAVLLGSSGLFFLLAGTVLLDVTFAFATTGALGAYLLHVKEPGRRRFGLLVFFFLALGLLAKGPVAAALVLLAIGADAAFRRSARALRALPWLPGIGILLLVAGPWYLLAERATPGFLRYFFIHEHWLRYLHKEYGDLYGHGHVSPYGLVWGLAFLAFLPWTPALFGAARGALRRRGSGAGDPAGTCLWIAALAPLVFFTFSRSLSLPYVLPSLPFLALLLAREEAEGRGAVPRRSLLLAPVLFLGGVIFTFQEFRVSAGAGAALVAAAAGVFLLALGATRSKRPMARLAAGVSLVPLFLLAASLGLPGSIAETKSTRHLAETIAGLGADTGETVLFHGGIPLSAEFYLRGRVARFDPSADGTGGDVGPARDRILVLREGRERDLPLELLERLRPAGASGRHRVYRLPARSAPEGGGEEAP